jgi:hypothetical protein
MKLLRKLLFSVVCVAAVTCFSLDRNAFTFTNYDLNLQIEPGQQRLGVRGKIRLRNDSGAPQRNAVLQISSSLDWRSIKVNGEAAQFVSQTYTSDIDHTGALSEAIISFPREIPPKGTAELEFGYEGVIPLDTTRLTRIGVPEDTAKHSDWDQIGAAFTAVRGIGYVTWYPVATEAASLSEGNMVFETAGAWKSREQDAHMHLQVCLTAATEQFPTALVNDIPTGDSSWGRFGGPVGGLTSSCGEHDFPSLGFTVPTFAVASFSRSGAPPVSVYSLQSHAKSADVFTAAGNAVMPFLADWVGPPSRSIQVIDMPDLAAAPFESGLMLLVPLPHADPKLAEMLLVHQLTHSAFHSPRPWIDEGFAYFAQALWRQQQAGRQAALDYMGLHRTALAEAEKAAADRKDTATAQSLISTTEEEYYRSKAMFVWWMLRDMVGEPALKKAIAAYRPAHDNAPSYVQKLIAAQSHRDLELFFDDWVYRDRGLPDFRIATAYTRQMLKGTYLVTVSVENLGAAGAEVPVRVRLEGGEVTSKVEVHGKSTAAVRIEVPSPPQEIIVNDGSVPESDTGNNTFAIQEPKK